jgi:anti-sigma regulatory factor (Ser/Thr protein kinase)
MDLWARLVSELADQATILSGPEVESSLTLDFTPKLALLSSDIYPDPQGGLVQALRTAYPDIDIVVLASSGAPHIPLRPLLVDKVRHLAVADPVEGTEVLRTLIQTLNDGKNWEFMSYLHSKADCREFQLGEIAEKEVILSHIEDLVRGTTPDLQQLQQSAVLLADEMIENAFQAAPPNSRAQDRVTIRAGFDGETLALQVVDVWGTLTSEKALELLTRHQEGQVTVDTPRGRGLFILWQFFDHLHINIKPGRETAIGGQLRRGTYLESGRPKGFDFFNSPAGGS